MSDTKTLTLDNQYGTVKITKKCGIKMLSVVIDSVTIIKDAEFHVGTITDKNFIPTETIATSIVVDPNATVFGYLIIRDTGLVQLYLRSTITNGNIRFFIQYI